MMWKSTVFLIFAILIAMTVCGDKFIGPGDIVFERFEKCGVDQMDFAIELGLRRVNRTHIGFNAYLKLPWDLIDGIAVDISASKWGDGGWKPNQWSAYDSDVCKTMIKYLSTQWLDLMEAMGAEKQCPLPKGEYNLTNHILATTADVDLIYGKYKGDATLIKDGVKITCVRLYFNLQPAKN